MSTVTVTLRQHQDVSARIASPSYLHWLKEIFGSSLIGLWPMDETSGTTVYDRSGHGYNGTLYGTAAQTAGPSGKLVPSVPGAGNSGLRVNAAGLIAAFNANEGGAGVWVKVSALADWTDGIVRNYMGFFVSGANYFLARKNASNSIQIENAAGGVYSNLSRAFGYGTGWMHVFLTWSKSNNRLRAYKNGVLAEETTMSTGTWAGSIGEAMFGSFYSGTQPWKGYLDTALLLNREATEAEVRATVQMAPAAHVLRCTILGDSVSVETPGISTEYWPGITLQTYNEGQNWRWNRAVGGMGILYGAKNMAWQVGQAANDDADLIFVALGINDTWNGDMVALGSAYQSGLATLKATNRRARIVSINAWPTWTGINFTGIRLAISTACAARGVLCLDPYGEGWYGDADTSDHIHPTVTGHGKIATQMVTKL